MSTVSFRQLCDFIERKRPGQVRRWLEDRNVLYFHDAEGHPCTTEKALNEALERGRRTRPNYL